MPPRPRAVAAPEMPTPAANTRMLMEVSRREVPLDDTPSSQEVESAWEWAVQKQTATGWGGLGKRRGKPQEWDLRGEHGPGLYRTAPITPSTGAIVDNAWEQVSVLPNVQQGGVAAAAAPVAAAPTGSEAVELMRLQLQLEADKRQTLTLEAELRRQEREEERKFAAAQDANAAQDREDKRRQDEREQDRLARQEEREQRRQDRKDMLDLISVGIGALPAVLGAMRGGSGGDVNATLLQHALTGQKQPQRETLEDSMAAVMRVQVMRDLLEDMRSQRDDDDEPSEAENAIMEGLKNLIPMLGGAAKASGMNATAAIDAVLDNPAQIAAYLRANPNGAAKVQTALAALGQDPEIAGMLMNGNVAAATPASDPEAPAGRPRRKPVG